MKMGVCTENDNFDDFFSNVSVNKIARALVASAHAADYHHQLTIQKAPQFQTPATYSRKD